MRRTVISLPSSFNAQADFNGRPTWSVSKKHLIYSVMNYYEFGERTEYYGRTYCLFFIDRQTLTLTHAAVAAEPDVSDKYTLVPNPSSFSSSFQEGELFQHKTTFHRTLERIWNLHNQDLEEKKSLTLLPKPILNEWAEQAGSGTPTTSSALPPFTAFLVEDDKQLDMETRRLPTYSFSFSEETHHTVDLKLCQTLCGTESVSPPTSLPYYHGEWLSLVRERNRVVLASHLHDKTLYLATSLFLE